MIRLKLFTQDELEKLHLSIVREIGRVSGVKSPASMKKEEIIADILDIQNGRLKPEPQTKSGAPTKMKIDLSPYYVDDERPYEVDPQVVESGKFKFSDSNPIDEEKEFEIEGLIDILPDGYGFIRGVAIKSKTEDIYVSTTNIKRYNLVKGDYIKGTAKFVKYGDCPALQSIIKINEYDPQVFLNRKNFDTLTPYYPTTKIYLERDDTSDNISERIIDLFCPIGLGQRGLIVAPPKTGKTTLLKKIAQSLEHNMIDVKLIVLLIDERPEEVTDFKRCINGEVISSTFDEVPENHIKTAELVLNKAKRLVEIGKNVFILMDSITRLARAYNNTIESSGKTLSGGIDPLALIGPKKFFGSARNIEGGGSLTIISTALVDTGSRMDDVIFEEFKGTGNLEIHLSRTLADKRIFPAIDIIKSGTRKEELLSEPNEIDCAMKLRKLLADDPNATEKIINEMKKTKANYTFINKTEALIKAYNNK